MTDVSGAKRADLAGPGIGSYDELERVLPNDYRSLLDPAGDAAGDLRGQALHRGRALPRARPGWCRCRSSSTRERRQRHTRPRRLAHAGVRSTSPTTTTSTRSTPQVVQAATKWKRMALAQFGMGPGEGLVHRHARRAQGLLPRPRPQRLRRPVGLGAHDHRRAAQPATPHRRPCARIWRCSHGAQALRPRAVPAAARRRAIPSLPEEIDVHPRRGPARPLSRPAAQAARDGDPAGAPGGLHLRHRLDARRRLPARDAGRRLRRLGHAETGPPTAGRCTGSTATSWSGTR